MVGEARVGGPKTAVVIKDGGADGAPAFGMGVGGEGTSPGDIAMAGEVGSITPFAKGPFAASECFAKGKVIGGDVGLGSREALLGNRELVHEGEAEVVLFGGEVHFHESAGVLFGGFPADLAAEAGFIAGGLDVGEVLEEVEEDSFEEVPILGAAGEECAQPKLVGLARAVVELDHADFHVLGDCP